ncbi:PAS domain S-box protein [Solidesulfovibrio magneticus]|uniref:histidine kinase n=1 Tax=Solidesulfovibrio magneticus (strain ATCC 700980 / DSM 13731 / RS-1) TaxID=573370 RepID=C4XK14_SOLM1|nr:PAS domain S-box protein [Solidesulfovibrio magneticus]BAH74369.1 two-component hybrid sensor and regulator [Solidesulfovibrio magneticus RS-1]
MESKLLTGLAHNISLLLAVALLFDVTATRWKIGEAKPRQGLVGLLLGAVGLVVMSTPWTLMPGVVFDTRSVLLGISGLFFGLIPTTIAVGITAAYRLHQGGPGAWTGVYVILASGAIGILWRYFRRSGLARLSFGELLLFGLAIHLAMLGLMLTLPSDIAWNVLSKITLPVLLIYPLGTALVGKLMSIRASREEEKIKTLESEEKYRALYASVMDPILVAETDTGIIVECNPAAEELFHRSRKELLGMHQSDLHPAGEVVPHTKTPQFCRQVASPDQVQEVRFSRSDGDIRTALVRASVFHLQGRALILGVFHDITERKAFEEALIKSEQKWRHVLLNTPQIGISLDVKAKVLFANQYFLDLTGWHEDEILGQDWFDLFIPTEVREQVRSVFDAVMSQQHIHGFSTYENEIMTRAGEKRVVSWANALTLDHKGYVIDVTCLGVDVTERRRAEQALRDSEERYRRLVETANEGIWSINAEHVITLVNHAMAEMLGYEVKEIIGHKVEDFIFPEEFDQHTEKMQARHAGASDIYERRLIRKDGSILWTIVSAKALTDDDGNFTGAFAMFTDITERKHMEEKLRANESRLISLVEVLQHPFTEPQEFLDFALHEAIRLTESKLGYIYLYDEKTERLTLNSWSRDVMHECTIVKPHTHYDLKGTGVWGEAVRQRSPIVINDFQAYHPLKKGYPDGHAKLYSYMTIPVFREGKIVSVVGVANKEGEYTDTDVYQLSLLMDAVWKVLDREEAESALHEREAQLASLSDNLPQGMVYQLDSGSDGTIRHFTYLSAGVMKLHGVSPEQVLADANILYNQIIEEDRAVLAERENQAIQSKSTFSAEVRMKMPSGEIRWHLLTSAPRRTLNAHTIWDGVEIDIDDLMKSKEAAENANRAKSEFLANMSHEIRTPLNGVLGMLQLLETAPLGAEEKEYVDEAITASKRLTNLLSDILDLSRIEAGKLNIRIDEFSLADMFDSVDGLLAATARKKDLELRFFLDEQLPSFVLGDEVRLRQILFNLVGNAIKFSDQGTISVQAYLLPFAKIAQERILFMVSDEGIGISDELLGLIFEPFSQGEGNYTRRFQGAGLGLSIVKRLVGLLEGEIAIESAPGLGTTVYLSLPFGSSKKATGAISLPNIPLSSHPSPAQYKVLLVEDEDINVVTVKALLKKHGYAVIVATDGQQAIEVLSGKEIDLVLMDIRMPIMDGVQATLAIRSGKAGQDKKDVPIIAMTAYAMTGDREKFLAAGMNDYIAKPVDIQDLKEVIKRVLGPR